MAYPEAFSPSSAGLDLVQSPGTTARTRWLFLALNALGGLAVVGSYAFGLLREPDPGRVWGGVPEALKPLYTASMLAAAVGYFPMTLYVLFGLDPARTRIGSLGWGVFFVLYALILIPSALWMPLTFAHLDAPSADRWLAVRGVLAAVGVGSLGLLAAIAGARPRGPRLAWVAALVGAAAFVLQTTVLDAIVWPAYFPG
jgi:hypothetical protein